MRFFALNIVEKFAMVHLSNQTLGCYKFATTQLYHNKKHFKNIRKLSSKYNSLKSEILRINKP